MSGEHFESYSILYILCIMHVKYVKILSTWTLYIYNSQQDPNLLDATDCPSLLLH